MLTAGEVRTLSRRTFLFTASRLAVGVAVTGLSATRAQARTVDERAWRELARRLAGPVLRPRDGGFAAAARPNNLRYARILPAGIARCASSQDVAQAILWSREHGIPLIARSGGHSYAGFSTTHGLMIDVSLISAATFDRATGIARFGGGVRNAGVADLLAQHDVTMTHGRCPRVGLAGFLLGGGIGFNMRQHGIGSDQLVASELVTADGRIVTLGPGQDAELFWACRGGGGGNFGISTSFSVQTVPTEPVTVFRIIWGTQPEEVLAALMPALDAAPVGLGSRISLSAISPRQLSYGQDVGISLLGQYKGPAEDLLDILAPAYGVAPPGEETLLEMSYWQGQSFLGEPGPAGFYQERSWFVTDGALGSRALETAFRWLRRWPGAAGSADLRFFQTGGQVNAMAPEATAFVHRDSHWLMLVGRNWTANESAHAIAQTAEWQDDFYEALRPFADGKAYQNFVDPSLVGWPRAYYGRNLDALRCIKGRVDPDRVFRFAQAIPPAHCP
jgi:FAD/FMN-containing dehydrogenase